MLLVPFSRSIGLRLWPLEQRGATQLWPAARRPLSVFPIFKSKCPTAQALPHRYGTWKAQRSIHSLINTARTRRTYRGHSPHLPSVSLKLTDIWQSASMNRISQLPFLLPIHEAKKPYLPRALLFFFATALGSFGLAAWYSVRDSEHIAAYALQTDGEYAKFISILFRGNLEGAPKRGSEAELRFAKQIKSIARKSRGLARFERACQELPLSEKAKRYIAEACRSVLTRYENIPEPYRVLCPVMSVNVLIFSTFLYGRFVSQGATKSSDLIRFLLCNLTHRPAANRVLPMITSTFSHMTLARISSNLFFLSKVGAMGLCTSTFFHNFEGRPFRTAETSLLPSFLAFFVTAGAGASLASHLWTRLLWSAAKLTKGAHHAKLFHGRVGLLGSSGAFYGLLTLYALAFPTDGSMRLVILPCLVPTPREIWQYLLTFDVAGLLVLSRFVPGWNFAHASHLGGAFIGWIYFHFGNEYWEWWKRLVVQGWSPEMMYYWANASKYIKASSKSRCNLREAPSRPAPEAICLDVPQFVAVCQR